MTLTATQALAEAGEAGLRHRFTVDEYYAMGEAGILTEAHRTELIEMPPIGPSHSGTVDRMNHTLARQIGDHAIVRVQNPIQLDEWSLPQPDAALLRFRSDFYTSSQPMPSDIALVIEVSVTTLRYDRDIKLPLYARAGIPEVWIVQPRKGTITAYRDPLNDAYTTKETFTRADELTVPSMTVRMPVRDLIGDVDPG